MLPLEYNLKSLLVRRSTAVATSAGVALVTAVLAASLMMAQGAERTVAEAGREEVAVVLRQGSHQEMSSSIDAAGASLVLSGRTGAAEVVVVIALKKIGADGISNVVLRGIEPGSFALRPQVRLVEGRMPRVGTEEAIVGRRILGRFEGLAMDSSFELKRNRPVAIVGVFEDGGHGSESEVWIDRSTLQSAFGRGTLVSSVRVALGRASDFDAFEAAIEGDKRLGFAVERESVFLAAQSEG